MKWYHSFVASEWLTVVLICFVVYRVTRFILDDRITQPVVVPIQHWAERRWAAKEEGRNAEEGDEWRSSIAYLLSCPWCVSVYVAAATVPIFDTVTSVPLPVAVAIAASGFTGLASTWEHRE